MSLNTLKSRRMWMVLVPIIAGIYVLNIKLESILALKGATEMQFDRPDHPLGIGQPFPKKMDEAVYLISSDLATIPEPNTPPTGPAITNPYDFKLPPEYEKYGSLEYIVGPGIGRFPLDGLPKGGF